jgi:hypothetical protein
MDLILSVRREIGRRLDVSKEDQIRLKFKTIHQGPML